MTDKEKLKALLTEFGIGFDEEAESSTSNETRINCGAGYDAKVVGYIGFYTIFRFTAEGKFIEMGVYE